MGLETRALGPSLAAILVLSTISVPSCSSPGGTASSKSSTQTGSSGSSSGTGPGSSAGGASGSSSGIDGTGPGDDGAAPPVGGGGLDGAAIGNLGDGSACSGCLGESVLTALGKQRLVFGLSTTDDPTAAAAPFDIRYVYISGGL